MTYIATASQEPTASNVGLPPETIRRIADAVAAAESRTSAEIRVVVARAPLVQHPFFSVMWAALAALVLPWLAVLLWPMAALSLLQIQAIIFMVVAGLLMLPGMPERAVPRLALKAAARSAAIEAFLSHGVSQTRGRTGILIFAAAREHLIEVVADEGVHGPLGAVAWAEICDTVARTARQGHLADGLVAGVQKAGELLASELPPQPGDTDELDNRVVIV
ncbi:MULTISPECIES: TPM domain-containing protein [unclassified Xanthobacter]|uniref:TPM domain-containing protein n=1 Tax=unclassified Xanthobacter TaxID=2623496 RepID=UPI001EDFAD3E|nr:MULTISPECIES: hypothetical protein [unclassified Xanthobacter]